MVNSVIRYLIFWKFQHYRQEILSDTHTQKFKLKRYIFLKDLIHILTLLSRAIFKVIIIIIIILIKRTSFFKIHGIKQRIN